MTDLSLPNNISNTQLVSLNINEPSDLYLIYEYLLHNGILVLSMGDNNILIIRFYNKTIDQFTLKCNSNSNCFAKRFNSVCTHTQFLLNNGILTAELLTTLYQLNDLNNMIFMGNKNVLSLVFILEWINNLRLQFQSNSIQVSVNIRNYKEAKYNLTLANLLFKILNYILDIIRTESSFLYNLIKGSPLANVISTFIDSMPLAMLNGTVLLFQYVENRLVLIFYIIFKGKSISSDSLSPEIFNEVKNFILSNINEIINAITDQISGRGSSRQMEDLINKFFVNLMNIIPDSSDVSSINDVKNGIPIMDLINLLDLIKKKFETLIFELIDNVPPEYSSYTNYIIDLYQKLTFKDILIEFIILLSLNLYNDISLVKNTLRNTLVVKNTLLSYGKSAFNTAKLASKNLMQEKCEPKIKCTINRANRAK